MKAGPDGRIYVGTQSGKRAGISDEVDGKLYSIEKGGKVRVLLDGLRLSNGLDWSIDEKYFYHTDSDTNIIKEYAFDGKAGSIEFTGKTDYDIIIDGNCTKLDVYQFKAKSIVHLNNSLKEASYSKRAITNMDDKIVVAKKAVEFASSERSIFIDSGSTMATFARHLPDEKYYIFTNAPDIALEVVSNQNAIVHLIGGELSKENLCLSGFGSSDFLDKINIDVAFIAASGYSIDRGFSVGNFNEAQLKSFIIKKLISNISRFLREISVLIKISYNCFLIVLF